MVNQFSVGHNMAQLLLAGVLVKGLGHRMENLLIHCGWENSPEPSNIRKTQCSMLTFTEENRGTAHLAPHFFCTPSLSGKMSQSPAELSIQQSCHWLYSVNPSVMHLENYVIDRIRRSNGLILKSDQHYYKCRGTIRELCLGNYRHSWPILLCLLCFYFNFNNGF